MFKQILYLSRKYDTALDRVRLDESYDKSMLKGEKMFRGIRSLLERNRRALKLMGSSSAIVNSKRVIFSKAEETIKDLSQEHEELKKTFLNCRIKFTLEQKKDDMHIFDTLRKCWKEEKDSGEEEGSSLVSQE